jgi:BlaI family transcriptional regulator, penicillinase repressor
MKPALQISEAESAVMEVLWKSHPLAADDVFRALAGEQSWQEPTVKTLLNRLLRKGAIRAEPNGRRYLYSPVLPRDEWQDAESRGFVERVFGGHIGPLIAHFGRSGRLSRTDLEELRKLVEAMSDER